MPIAYLRPLLHAVLVTTLAVTLPACGSSDTGTPVGANPPGGNPSGDDNGDPSRDLLLGIWPIGATTTPDCIQDGFGHRELGGGDDFHPGLDTCDDNASDVLDSGDANLDEVGFDVHIPLDGIVTRARLWNPAWDDADPDNDDDDPNYDGTCSPFCRQGNFIIVRHPDLEAGFDGKVVQTVHMHLAQDTVTVVAGDVLKQGDVIGKVGRTGHDINTTHLHMGLLVGSEPGKINFDDYINPLRILPYESLVAHRVELDLENDASVFDAGECEAAETATAKPVLSLQLAQAAPAMDVSRIEVRKTGEGALLGVLDIEQRIGVGNKTAGTDADDFQQGCVAVTAHSFNENEQDYVLDVRFGGDWTAGSYMVSLLNVRGETREYTLDAN